MGELIWTIHVDDWSSTLSSEARLIMMELERDVLKYALRFGFPTFNNEAEYGALITMTTMCKEAMAKKIKAYSKSN